MNGSRIRLNRLSNTQKNGVIAALDAGGFFGPYPGLIDIKETCDMLFEADAILIEPGMIEICKDTFLRNNAPLLITRLNWDSDYCFQWNYNKSCIVKTLSPLSALSKGADLAVASLSINTGNEELDSRNIKIFTDIIEEANKIGLPIIGEIYPPVKKYNNGEFNDFIYKSCRIAVELGADAIKTFYTEESFKDLVNAIPVPLFALGGDKKEKDIFSLIQAENSIKDGAKGLVFGRNLYQANNPSNYLRALKEIASNNLNAKQAAEKYSLSF
jgi:class I fructose-bisphosphate aldolase